jgi:hypothetical protein
VAVVVTGPAASSAFVTARWTGEANSKAPWRWTVASAGTLSTGVAVTVTGTG